MRPARGAVPLAALAALLAGAVPFAVSVTAWPEIVTPAWFVTQGVRLYDGILFPHTPLLILLTAAAGALFGFSAAVLRALPALALAATAALVVLGARPARSSRGGPAVGLLLGVPLLILLTVYADGPALWPEPFLAPFLLGGVLLLERAATTGRPRGLAAAGGPVFFWDDTVTRDEAASVRARVPAGGELLVFGGRQTLYPITATRAPGGFYVNPQFWYCLDRDRGDERLVTALAARPGLPVLFREPLTDAEAVRTTGVYAFLESSTVPDGPAPGGSTWRRVAGHR